MAIKNVHTGEIIDDDERGLTIYRAAGSGMLMPLGTPQEAQAAITAYEQLKTAIVRPDDIQVIQGHNFLKKSFWRRVATCFGLSLEMIGEERLLLDGKLAYRATYRAIAPNGRTMDGDGMCMQGEKGQMIEHNIRAIAHTRAKNRAISDIVGGGEVSAEEMPDNEIAPSAPQQPRQQPTPKPAPRATSQPAASPWNAMTDPTIATLLETMEVVGEDAQLTALRRLREDMKRRGMRWNQETTHAELRQQAAAFADAFADPADPVETESAADLADLDTGAPGN